MLALFAFFRIVLHERAALLADNALLRYQILVLQRSVRRPRLRALDRGLWVLVSMVWRRWRECLLIVRPATVVGWHRAGFRLFSRWKCGGGRPASRPDLRSLIARIAKENPLWGVPRIQAELALLGHRVARATIAKYSGRSGTNPVRSASWRAFIRNHLNSTAAIDFFTLPTITGRVLYVFLVLGHARRWVLHYHVTAKPCAEWVARQLREAFPFDMAPKFLIHDNDGNFGEAVSRMLRLLGIREVKTSSGSPWQNAYVERLIGTVRREPGCEEGDARGPPCDHSRPEVGRSPSARTLRAVSVPRSRSRPPAALGGPRGACGEVLGTHKSFCVDSAARLSTFWTSRAV